MTEAEWLVSDDPVGMLHRVDTASVRKQRLLYLACCRRLNDLMQNEDLQQSLRTAESWIEGGTDLAERKNARRVATAAALLASRASIEERLTLSDGAAWAVQRLLELRAPEVDRILFALAQAQLKDAGARAHLYETPREIADQLREEAFVSEQRSQA